VANVLLSVCTCSTFSRRSRRQHRDRGS
jgi:hypothetical protein